MLPRPRPARAATGAGSAGFDLDVALGDVQFQQRGDQPFPFPGGQSVEEAIETAFWSDRGNSTLLYRFERGAVLNGNTGLTGDGYAVNHGNSYVLALAFTDAGPKARAVMVCSQSEDPDSAHHDDQSGLYATQALRPVLFREEDILADPDLWTETLSYP